MLNEMKKIDLSTGAMIDEMDIWKKGRASFHADVSETVTVAELAALVETSNKNFTALMDANDERLKQIENKGVADIITQEKMDKINAEISETQSSLDTLTKKMARLNVGADTANNADISAHTAQFGAWFRRGVEGDLSGLQIQAGLSTDSDPDGGFLVPTEIEKTIDRVVGTVSAMRSEARVITIGGSAYKKLINMGGASSGWVAEREAPTETSTPTLRALEFTTMECYAEPAATQTMLDDATIDIATWLADEVSIEFAEQEGAAFITGSGVGKPKGLLAYPTVDNASWTWGNIGTVASGSTTGFPKIGATTADDADAIIKLEHAVKPAFRPGAKFIMNDTVLMTCRTLKDAAGNYIYQPSLLVGSPETLLGKPVVIDDNMPNIAANSLSIAFGNFHRSYMIVDRRGIRVLRDPFTGKPNVKFYTTKRVGGGVQNFEAVKLMQFKV